MELFLSLLKGAAEAGASDIHLKPGGPVIFRISRELKAVEAPLPTEAWMRTVLEDITPPYARERLEKDREVDFAYHVPGLGRYRINVYQQRGLPVLAIRHVPERIRSFDELHLPPIIRRISEARRGIIILAGAPGSGKSTTLAAILEHLNQTVRRHIITLEDPIEYAFRDNLCVIEQREVGLDTASFASGLRNVLRQDPDVLVIGEMRELGSVAAAVTAANLGAMVITTLHTGDTTRSIQRILEFFPGTEREHARRQLAATLEAVICQRLLRSTKGSLVPALEVLVNTSGIAKLIEGDRLDKIPASMEMGAGDGMQTFDQAIYALSTSGQITQKEALEHVDSPESFKMKLQGVMLNETRRILSARD